MPLSVTATKTDPTVEQKVTVLKHLITGREADFIATVTGLTRDQVGDVKRDHGYPDVDKMSWALDILEKRAGGNVHEQISKTVAAVTRRPAPAPAPRPDLSRAQQPPTVTAPTVPDPSPAADVLAVNPGLDVVALGLKSDMARTRVLALKITSLMADLERRLADEQEDRRAKAKAAAENARRKARIAELEAEIAALKGKDPTGPAKSNANLSTGRGAKRGVYPCDAEGCERVLDSAQGVALHRRRAHEGYDPNATTTHPEGTPA